MLFILWPMLLLLRWCTNQKSTFKSKISNLPLVCRPSRPRFRMEHSSCCLWVYDSHYHLCLEQGIRQLGIFQQHVSCLYWIVLNFWLFFVHKAILTIMTSFMSFIKLYICSGGSEDTALQMAAGVSVGSEL